MPFVVEHLLKEALPHRMRGQQDGGDPTLGVLLKAIGFLRRNFQIEALLQELGYLVGRELELTGSQSGDSALAN